MSQSCKNTEYGISVPNPSTLHRSPIPKIPKIVEGTIRVCRPAGLVVRHGGCKVERVR